MRCFESFKLAITFTHLEISFLFSHPIRSSTPSALIEMRLILSKFACFQSVQIYLEQNKKKLGRKSQYFQGENMPQNFVGLFLNYFSENGQYFWRLRILIPHLQTLPSHSFFSAIFSVIFRRNTSENIKNQRCIENYCACRKNLSQFLLKFTTNLTKNYTDTRTVRKKLT